MSTIYRRSSVASTDRRLTAAELSFWAVLGLCAVFLCLGGLFIAAPTTGALIFGIPAPGNIADAYLRAIGFRDAALALYLAGLVCFSSHRAVCIVLGASVLIPVCDVALVVTSGTAAWWQIALHAVSAICLSAVTAWVSLSAS
ncbi:DUF4267 domain-containing protein [Methylobacterium nodulans]|uniref:DUF4267 domain-containing protein n=1 Tax=Methylobacterium nodulans (strain LMG 21967 / CNCM I-2342 / ORS 2060) TaxID=460265 RepID=B8IQT6_METNO|nr:DUF4267 domain-containing protein [Methylobacterium nodulans]ACL62381.1 conserved hypothetical protein [Methylobacterium nodulans ORS 2060]